MLKNKLGTKIIGSALSMAVAITAIPAMTSLACERVPEGDYGVAPMVISRDVSREELAERLEVIEDARLKFHITLDLMRDFANAYAPQLKVAIDYNDFCNIISDGYDIYNHSDECTSQELIEVTNDYIFIYNDVIDRLIAAGFPNPTVPAVSTVDEDPVVPDYSVNPSYRHAYSAGPLADVTLEELTARYTEVANYYYQNESKIPMGLHPQSEDTLNYASSIIRNPDSTPCDYAFANNDLESLNMTIAFFADSDMPVVENGLLIAADDTEVREAALNDLYDTLYEMSEFYEAFENEIAATVGTDTYVSWVDFGMDVYCDNEAFSIEEIDNLNETLQNIYASTIDAIDAASQPAEEIAPDYGMNLDEEPDDDELVIDHQDDFTIEGEEPIVEDEFVAPDYGMDLDEEIDDEQTDTLVIETVVDETIADETVDETAEQTTEETAAEAIEETIVETDTEVPAETPAETPAEATAAIPEITTIVILTAVAAPEVTPATAPAAAASSEATSIAAPAAVSAPAAQVLGVTRDRRAIANEIVEGLYNNVLNRAFDESGKTFWVNTILADYSNLDMVIASFVTSTEFNARNLNDDEFIALLYRVILNRAPSASEKNLWMSALSNGAARIDVVNAFINSSEYEAVSEAYGL